jgi:hypothetical protein
MNIGSLFVRLGINADTNKAQGFIKSLVDIKAGADMVIGTIGKVISEIKQLTDESLKSAVALKQFHAETGADTGQLQMWQSVATQANISAESVTNSVKSIIDNQEKMKLGQGNISGYQLLGINPNEDPFKVLDKLREKTQGLSQGMKKNVLGMLGVNAEMIQVLDLTNDQFDRMKKNAFVLSPGQIDMMAKADASIKMMGKGFDYIKAEIVTALSPAIIKFMTLLTKWMTENKSGFLKVIQDIVGWIVKFVVGISNAAHMIDMIIKNTIGWKSALTGLVALIAIFNSALLFSPIGLFSMMILGLILVLDDLAVYFKDTSNSDNSIMGMIMAKFPKLKAQFDTFLETIKEVFGLLRALWNGDSIDEYMDKLGELGASIIKIKASLATTGALIAASMNSVIQTIISFFDLFSTFKEAYVSGEWVKEFSLFWERYKERGASIVGGFENVKTTAQKGIKPLEDYNQRTIRAAVQQQFKDQSSFDDFAQKEWEANRLKELKSQANITINQTNNFADKEDPNIAKKITEGMKTDLNAVYTNKLGGNNPIK